MVGRNYGSASKIYSSATASDDPALNAWEGDEKGEKGALHFSHPVDRTKQMRRAKDQTLYEQTTR